MCATTPPPPDTLPPSFLEKITLSADTDCWLWTGAITSKGDSSYRYQGLHYPGHRFSYLRLIGPIPDGHVLTRMCKTERCVNPAHYRCRPRKEHSDIERFWRLVDVRGPGDCWPWLGGWFTGLYGSFDYTDENGNSRRMTANRYSLGLKLGRPVTQGLEAAHTCDHPWCVNPDHLYEATPEQNREDKRRKGRDNARRGQAHPQAKVTENAVLLARQLYRSDWTVPRIAQRIGLSPSATRDLCTGRTWKHVGSASPPC